MTLDPTLLPGLGLLLLELLTLAAVGFVVARTALQQSDPRLALAHGLVIGPALWGLTANFLLHLLPGLAGASLAWVLILALAAALAWRTPHALRLPPRTLAAFLAATLALLWVALAARQLLKIPDPTLHLGLAAYIRAGGWPPITSWNPDFTLYYHHGVDLLIGLLAPPIGPDLVLVTELIGAYIWTSFALVVLTALLHRGGWLPTLVLAPLLLTAGAWTLLGYLNKVPNIVQLPVPTELHIAGLQDSLTNLYRPRLPSGWYFETEATPANIWKPNFVMAYALVLIIVMSAAANRRATRLATSTLVSMVGFLGLLSAELSLLALALWGGLIATQVSSHPDGQLSVVKSGLRDAVGLVCAMIVLAASGGFFTGILTGSPRGHLLLGLIDDPLSRQVVGRYESLQGGIGLIGLGAITIAAIASLLARRDRLILALAVGTIPLMVAAVTLRYTTAPLDVTRFDGHARNFALLALLLALAGTWKTLRSHWRYGASILTLALVVWPTIAHPARTLGLAISRGVQLTNPPHGALASDSEPYHHDLRRYALDDPLSPDVISFIRDETLVSARIFSPSPSAMSIATGRPNAMGFVGHIHQEAVQGPAYDDVAQYLEPASVRKVGFEYIHATQSWVSQLPIHAQRWLDDTRLFEPLVRTESDALYRVKPLFLQQDSIGSSGAYEALSKAVPSTASVYLAPGIRPRDSLKLAMAISHAHLIGTLDPVGAHLLTPIESSEQIGPHDPDFVALPTRMAPSALAGSSRTPIWWNSEVALYAADHVVEPLTDPPRRDFSVTLSDAGGSSNRISFTAEFTDRATDLWTGQDWVVVATDDSPWRLPYRFSTGTFTSAFVRWFDGQVQPVPETDTHDYIFLYQFDPRTGTLALWDGAGYTDLSSPQPQLQPGNWMLAARPNINGEEVGLIPVLHVTLAHDGTFTYKVYEGSLDTMLVR